MSGHQEAQWLAAVRRATRLIAVATTLLAPLSLASPARAAKVKIFRVNSASAYLEGTLSGTLCFLCSALRQRRWTAISRWPARRCR